MTRAAEICDQETGMRTSSDAAELLSRAVGPTGKVYGQNPKWALEQYAEKWWSNRLTKPVKVNRAVFQALQPGGIYAIVDHSARAGAEGTDAKAHPASLVPPA
jgi:predicted methyltransferase